MLSRGCGISSAFGPGLRRKRVDANGAGDASVDYTVGRPLAAVFVLIEREKGRGQTYGRKGGGHERETVPLLESACLVGREILHRGEATPRCCVGRGPAWGPVAGATNRSRSLAALEPIPQAAK